MHHVRIEVTGAAGRNLDGGDAVFADAVGIVLGFEIAFDYSNVEFIFKCVNAGFEQRRSTGAGRRHQVDGEYAMAVKVLPIVHGGVIICAQQPAQHRDGLGTTVGSGQFAARCDQVGIARGYIAAAGVAHGVDPFVLDS